NELAAYIHSAFVVRIPPEIPLFHVLNARITFGNIFAMESPVDDIMCITEDGGRLSCVVEDRCFALPASYTRLGEDASAVNFTLRTYDEDEFLQFAIQESLLEQGSGSELVNVWEVLGTAVPGDEDRMMQR
ncbi:unnamed protein product, partial [Cyprideis torosa]